MTVFDYTVLAIVVLSIVISVIRGLLREVLALAAWAIGFIVASVFAADAAALLAPQVPDERVRLLVAFSGVFLAVLLGMSLLAMLLSRLAQSAGFGLEDRVLGSVFGLARGVPAVCLTRSAYYDAKFAGLRALFPGACQVVSLDQPDLAGRLGQAIDQAWHLPAQARDDARKAAAGQRQAGREAYARFRDVAEKNLVSPPVDRRELVR